jgi:hypothetical protein
MRVLKKSIWPHQVVLKPVQVDIDERIFWLKERLPKDRWYVIAPHTYCFKTQQDAVLFSLKWS